LRVIQPPNEMRVDSFVKRKIMVGLRYFLNSYNYSLILSRNLYFGYYTRYRGLLHSHKIACNCHYQLSVSMILFHILFVKHNALSDAGG
jgi:hypothetical protein